MKNISETDGLSREHRLKRASAPVVLPLLEERFSVLLARALCSSDFTSVYQYQSLVVLLEIEQFDTHEAEEAFLRLQDEKDFVPGIFSLVSRFSNWKKRLEYSCLGSISIRLLRDLSGQIATNISPLYSLFSYLFDSYKHEKPDALWFSFVDKHKIEDLDEQLPRRLYLLLLSTIRLLQARQDAYREEIYTLGRMDPSLAALVAFLHNYEEMVARFNKRWQSLPMLYLNEILKVSPRKRISGTTWFTFEKSPADAGVVISQGTFFPASKEDIVPGYRLLSDIRLTDMQPLKIRRIIMEKHPERYPEAALQYVTAVLQSDRLGEVYSPSPIGLRIHSSMLLLGEGRREVNILFRLTSESLSVINDAIDSIARVQEISHDEAQFKILYDAFYLQISTIEGERMVERFHIRLQRGIGLLLVFRLDENFPTVVPLAGEFLPSLQLLVNPGAWLFPYSWACRMFIKSVRIHVSVDGLRNFQLYNELGYVDSHQPFAPFGVQGEKGAWFAFGSYEMACKPVREIGFSFNWQQLPTCHGGLKEYYESYGQDIDNHSFRGRIDQLRNRVWKSVDASESCYLFRTVGEADVPGKADMLTDRTTIRFTVNENSVLPLGQEDSFRLGEARSGFYRLVMTAPDMGFGIHEYRRLFAEIMMLNSHKRKKDPLPTIPLSPLMDTPCLSYIAEEEYYFSVGNALNIHISYIRPLSDGVVRSPDTTRPIPLIEGPRDEGNLMIGITNAVGENLLRLYIEMELLQREINHVFLPSTDWYYRDASRWVQVDPVNLLRDDTGGLMNSGPVTLQLPFCITSEMIDEDGLFWLCVAVHTNFCNCSKVRGVYLNVAEAEPVGVAGENPSIPGLTAYRPVALVTGNRSEETDVELRNRLSERIAHRHRLLLPHEYEQMTLQEFPEVVKVKCLPRIDQKGQNRRTVITLAVIRSRQAGEYPLCTDELLCRIENCLQQYASPFVNIDAINPVYEEVTVFCGVSLKEGEAAGTAIQEVYDGLRSCIAPWEEGEKPPVLGYSFSLRDMLGRIKEGGRISAVHGLKLIKVTYSSDGRYDLCEYNTVAGEEQLVSPSVPWAVLVPAARHYVKVVSKDEWRQDIEFGDLEINNTFVIK